MNIIKKHDFPKIGEGDSRLINKESLEFIKDVPLNISFVLGEVQRNLKQVDFLKKGTYIECDKEVNLPIDIVINGKKVGKGQVCVSNDNKLTIKVI